MVWNKFQSSISSFWDKLNLVQRWYFLCTLALLLWLISFTSVEAFYLAFVGMLLIATMIDMWQSAIKIWHSLPGKVFLLASYAILANFCYAYAESQMNAISSVKAELTPFSVHFMIALQAPIWTFGLAMLMSIAYLMMHTTKIFLMALIRPLSKVHAEMMHQEHYPFISLIIRIVYLPVMLTLVGLGLEGYITGQTGTVLEVNNNGVYMKNEAVEAAQKSAAQQLPDLEVLQKQADKSAETPDDLVENFGLLNAVPRITWANKLVANFLYEVESQGKSHCKISGVEHAVQINDYEILVIVPDKTQELGYQFTVRGCNSANLPKILQLDTPSH